MKSAIAELIEKYNREKNNKYKEEPTKTDFILPLFRILGWNTEDSNEVSKEENISGMEADFGFRINGIPKFFLEAKALNEDLDGSRTIHGRQMTYAEQAINYSYYKGCNWAILTNFKEIRVYDAWAKNTQGSFRFAIRVDNFLDNFEDLYLLSKEAFEQELLDKKYSTKLRKIPITEQLLSDFTLFRSVLSKDIYKLNKSKNLTEEELDEAIQRLFDRLIFIRNCEDRELESPDLLSLLRQWKKGMKGTLISKVGGLFRGFDETYNSKIFSDHLCDHIDISDEVLERVLDGLYTTEDGSIQYDFSLIDADVLGNIYEQYLGHILKKTKKSTKLTESKPKRKGEGIYYTPTYIVDYIVRNTVGEYLKNKNIDVSKIRVLDPACGSGSFLIRAFDLFNAYYSKKEGYNQTKLDPNSSDALYSTKLSILTDNIFGVDLDKQAVDIAQLNLLLKIAEKKMRLPILQRNIKNGNSLVDDPNVAGEKAFKWEEEFKYIIDDGGFDVVIGNPPWVSFGLRNVGKMSKTESKFYRDNFFSAEYKLSTYALFVEKGIRLLKDGGYLSFILPDSFLLGRYFSKLRKFILGTCEIKKIVLTFYDVFSGKATTGRNVIIVLKKEDNAKTRSNNLVEVTKVDTQEDFEKGIFKTFQYKQSYFEKIVYNRFRLFFSEAEKEFVEHVERDSELLSKYMAGHTGVRALVGQKQIISKHKLGDTWKRGLVSGSQIGRYWLKYDNHYINIDPKLLNKGGWDPDVILNDKILIRQTGDRIYATLDTQKYYHLNNIHSFALKNKILDIRYILGILNSKMMSAYYILITLEKKRVMAQTDIEVLEKLPIKEIPLEEQEPIIKLVNEMLSLNRRLIEISDKNTEEKVKMEEEINKTDAKIDELVYKIYGITENEKKIIEEALK